MILNFRKIRLMEMAGTTVRVHHRFLVQGFNPIATVYRLRTQLHPLRIKFAKRTCAGPSAADATKKCVSQPTSDRWIRMADTQPP